MNSTSIFFKLLQAAVSNATIGTLPKEEWKECYELAIGHGL